MKFSEESLIKYCKIALKHSLISYLNKIESLNITSEEKNKMISDFIESIICKTFDKIEKELDHSDEKLDEKDLKYAKETTRNVLFEVHNDIKKFD